MCSVLISGGWKSWFSVKKSFSIDLMTLEYFIYHFLSTIHTVNVIEHTNFGMKDCAFVYCLRSEMKILYYCGQFALLTRLGGNV